MMLQVPQLDSSVPPATGGFVLAECLVDVRKMSLVLAPLGMFKSHACRSSCILESSMSCADPKVKAFIHGKFCHRRCLADLVDQSVLIGNDDGRVSCQSSRRQPCGAAYTLGGYCRYPPWLIPTRLSRIVQDQYHGMSSRGVFVMFAVLENFYEEL
jgi:hypothetical protein